jgi:hypothetical protein
MQLRNWRMAALTSMTVLFVLATLVMPLDTIQSLATLLDRSPGLPDVYVR